MLVVSSILLGYTAIIVPVQVPARGPSESLNILNNIYL